ncbi:MAG: hypothetical protein R3C49_11240 [Planctomycetaceae bacterium]
MTPPRKTVPRREFLKYSTALLSGTAAVLLTTDAKTQTPPGVAPAAGPLTETYPYSEV